MNASPRSIVRSLGWLLFALLACGHFALRYLFYSPQFLNLPLYANGGERLPYQGRILMAWLLHATAANPVLERVLGRVAVHLPSPVANPYTAVLLVVDFGAMFCAILAARGTLLHLTGSLRFASWAAFLTLYMTYFNLILDYGLTYVLPYDVLSLALFSIAVWAVVTRRDLLLLPIFVIGTLNRETFCFIPVFYVLYRYFDRRTTEGPEQARARLLRQVAPLAALQGIAWVAIRIWLRHRFVHNPIDGNGVFAFQLGKNLHSIANPPQWPLFLSLFGFTVPLLIAGYRWIGNRALARSTAIVALLWAAAMLLVGVVVEVRVFNELTAFFVPALALIAWNLWKEGPSRFA